jgi:hypothetical protein
MGSGILEVIDSEIARWQKDQVLDLKALTCDGTCLPRLPRTLAVNSTHEYAGEDCGGFWGYPRCNTRVNGGKNFPAKVAVSY